jgi:FAD/FMN-containing dehydrogenase
MHFLLPVLKNVLLVNDITQLNPVEVHSILYPTSVKEIQTIVRSREAQLYGISIGGAHCSMGGQASFKDSVHLDLSQFNQILNFDRENKLITLQTGISWRKVIEFIDQFDLSVMVMPSYADFTLGGSLSVNTHGRYIGHGSICKTVTEMKIVLGESEKINEK